jgi:hypothetical protein
VRAPAKCGTLSGYVRHRRRGEQTCEACRAAQAAYQRERSARRKAAANPAGPPAPPSDPARITVRWLLPPPSESALITEYARRTVRGHIQPISSDQAAAMMEAGTDTIYVRTVSLWSRMAADPAISPGWWRTLDEATAS